MSSNRKFLMRNKETGKFEEYTPYRIIYVETEEDYIEIKSAVAKQKAMKPTEFSTYNIDNKHYSEGHCPICGAFANNDSYYCKHCGQKLDWSIEK